MCSSDLYDVIQRVKGELPMITDTIDNVTTVERQQGLQQGLRAAMRLGRLLTTGETDRLIAYLTAHPMTVEQIAETVPEEIERWIAPAGPKNGTNGPSGR